MKLVFLALFLGVAAAFPAEYEYSDRQRALLALSRMSTFFNTPEGIQVIRDYAKGLEARSPVGFMVKVFIESESDSSLKEILNEMLPPPGEPLSQGNDIHVETHIFGEFMRTDEGLVAAKDYFDNLETSHQIVNRLKTVIANSDLESLRILVNGFLPPAYYSGVEYDVKADLRRLFGEIREVLITKEGLQVVRDYAMTLEPTHPALFLVKAFIRSAEDQVLLEILDEFFKGLSQSAQSANFYSAGQKLEKLFMEVRDIIKTDDGFQVLKQYLVNVKSDHPIVGRLSAFISNAADDTLRELLAALYGGAI